MKKRFLGILLSAALCMSCIPVTAVAEEAQGSAGSQMVEETYSVSAGDADTDTGDAADTASYSVYLPADYDESRSYPTVYLMPYDGYSADQYIEDGIQTVLDEIMDSSESLDMIVVLAEFEEGDDYRSMLDTLVADVDGKYATIEDASYRAILGVNVGGYMALETALISESETFYAVGSHMGDFTSEANPYVTEYGAVIDTVDALDETSRSDGYNTLSKHYYYLDAPNDDAFTTTEGGTTDIGAGLEKRTNPYYRFGGSYYLYSTPDTTMVEYAVLDGASDADFYLSSLSRSLNRFSTRFTEDLYSLELSCTPQAVTSAYDTMTAAVTVTLDEAVAVYQEEVPAVELTLQMIDPDTEEVLYETSATVDDIVAGEATEQTFTINRSDMASGTNTTLSVSAEFLGLEQEAATISLVSVQDTGTADDEQLVDLMGDWYFKAYKSYTRNDTTVVELDNVANITSDVYETWGVVQPGLGWWTSDFDSSLGGNSNYGGYAWYVRTFELPEDFSKEDLVLALGYFDEANEVYINGQYVGSTGMDYTIAEGVGVYDGSNPWETNCVYDLDSSILDYGGTNTIAVRMCNSSGGGGWYEGPIGIYSVAAYNKAAGKPSVYASDDVTEAVLTLADTWQTAVEEENIDAFAAAVSVDYFDSGYDKDRLIEKMQGWMDTYSEIEITDTGVGVFIDDDLYNYQAQRVVTGKDADGNTVEIVNEEVSEYYQVTDGQAALYGSHSRFFVDTYTSEALAETDYAGQDMTFRVYLPEGYFDSDNTERYQTLYLLHGINSTSQTYEIDDIDQVLDEAIASGELDEMIVIIPDDPTSSSFWRGAYANMVTDDLIPTVDERYRTINDARYRFIAGCSMGGAGSVTIGLYNPNLFSGIISFYGALSYTSILDDAEAMSAEYLQQYSIYMACGNQDLYNFYDCQEQMSRILSSKGVEHYHYIDNGTHASSFYLPLFVSSLQYQQERMYSTADSADTLSGTASVTESENAVTVNYSVDVSAQIADYLNMIVDSDYTDETNPDLEIPVEIRIIQDGVVVSDVTDFYDVNSAATLTGSIDVQADDLDTESTYTVRVYGSVLENTVLLQEVVMHVDTASLESAIASAESFTDSSLYTEESWNALQTALTEAKAALEAAESQDAVDAAAAALTEAIAALQEADVQTDTDSDGADTLVVRRGNTYYFNYSLRGGVADKVISYGKAADEVLVGDWDGDGVDTLCVRRGNTYYFSNSLKSGKADIVISYGKATDEVLAGDWDGDGIDTLCVRRGNTYYFSNSLKSGKADQVIAYGKATDTVIAGKWSGNASGSEAVKDTLCVRRGNTYYFSNSLKSGKADQVIAYGKATDEVLAGDWDGSGYDTLCVRRGNTYYFSYSLKNGKADQVIAYGKAADEVYAGTWK